MDLAGRVAMRFAMEHSTPEAMKEYLQAHPHADPSNHTLKVPTKEEVSSGGHGHEQGDHGHDSKFLGGIRGLAKKLKDAPAGVKKFFEDSSHRKEVLKGSAKDIAKSPQTYVQKLVKTLKHEGQEFKDAFGGVKGLMRGQKPTKAQKHAIKTVATHLAITGVAVALSGASPALAASAIGKALARHIALKAVSEVMGDLHILDEFGHIGHGLVHIMEKLASGDEKEFSPEEALSALVLKKVSKQLENLSDADIKEALEIEEGPDEVQDSKTASEVARRIVSSTSPEILSRIAIELKKMRSWAKTFQGTFKDSQKDSSSAPAGYVWQEPWVDFWGPFDPIQSKLYDLGASLEKLDPKLASEVDSYLEPPRAARIEEAISNPKFAERDGEEHIAYAERDLVAWSKAFNWWVEYAIEGVQSL